MNSEPKWIDATLKCKSHYRTSMKIESCINLLLMRRKRSKLTLSELSRKRSLILLIWWTKCPVFWFKTTRTLTNLEPWSMISDTSFTVKKLKKITTSLNAVESVKTRLNMEPYQISTLLEDHHSTRSRLFKSNSMLLSLTLEMIIWRNAPNLLKRLTIWKSAWFQNRRTTKMPTIRKSKKSSITITLLLTTLGSILEGSVIWYLKYWI